MSRPVSHSTPGGLSALPTRVRVGYGSGSVATGGFGTVPGLMLRAAGPVTVDPGSSRSSRPLDPAALSDEDVYGLLSDPSAGLALPERMAPVDAMLDLASPPSAKPCSSPSSTGCSGRCELDEYLDIRVLLQMSGVATPDI